MTPRRRLVGRWLRGLAAASVTAMFMLPVYWVLVTSFKTPEEIFSSVPVWWPGQFNLDNYLVLFREGDWRSLLNSLILASTSTVIAMIVGTAAGYVLIRDRIGGRPLAMGIIGLRLIPPVVLAFPIFLLYLQLGWVDTYHGLIILYTALSLPYVIWMMRGFVGDVPVEIEESARLDGCSRWGVLFRIVFPLVAAGMLATAVFAFVFAMNEFAFAIMLTRTNVTTFPVQLTRYMGVQSTLWGKLSAMAVLGSLPVLVVVLLLQRYLVRGISMGAVKG